MEWDSELGMPEGAAIALAILFGSLLLIIFFWNWFPRRKISRLSATELAETQAAMARLSVEFPQLLHSMNSRLDAKMQALRNLIREADTTIEELYRLRTPPAIGGDPSVKVPASVLAGNSDTMESPDIDITLPVPEAASVTHKPIDLSPGDTAELRSQRYAHVYSLADRGLDPAGISGETGMHRGEVELVLNLRRKRVRVDRASRAEPSSVIRSPEEAPA